MSGIAGKGCEVLVPFNERIPLKDIERSIVKNIESIYGVNLLKLLKNIIL